MQMSLLFNLYKLRKIQIMCLGNYQEKNLQGWSYKNMLAYLLHNEDNSLADFYGGYDI